MIKTDNENKEITTQDENQPKEINVDFSYIDNYEDVFALSEQKKVAIPLVPFKEIFLPYANKTIKMRKPITRDIKSVSHIQNEELRTYQLISNITGLSPTELEALEFRDFKVLNKEVQSFL